MRTGLLRSALLGGAAHVEVPWVKCGVAIGDFYYAASATRPEMNVAEPLFGARVRRRHFVNYFRRTSDDVAFSFDAEVVFGEIKRRDYAIAPSDAACN